MLVRFWGTRGSIATPGPATMRYGGNTACVEVRSGDTLIILDMGTGARALGSAILGQPGPVRAHLLLTHIHWDHIQGFPFFAPVFIPQTLIDVYGTSGLEQGLEEALAGQMQYSYFPVRLSDLRSRLNFHELGETTFAAGTVSVQTHFLNHTCPAVGYRLTAGGARIAYMTDHEPFVLHRPDQPLDDLLLHPASQRHVEFVAGVDLLVHDAQYTADEYPAKRGWGHSTIEYVVDVAVAARVKRLALFHHDPWRADDALDRLVEAAQARAVARGGDLVVFAAAEGQTLDLAESERIEVQAEPDPTQREHREWHVALLGTTVQRKQLREALVEDGYRFSEGALDGSGPVAEADNVALAVADLSGLEVGAAVQALERALDLFPGRPIVGIVDDADELTLRRLGEFTTDLIVGPYGVPNLRARIQAGLIRRYTVVPRRVRPISAIDNFNVLARLPDGEVQALIQAGTPCSFAPGDVICNEGDPPGGVYYLHHGLVRASLAAEDGQDVIVGFAGAGDTVGEMSALDGSTRSSTVIAMDTVEATYISAGSFRQALKRSPDAALNIMRMLARRLRDTDHRLQENASTRRRKSASRDGVRRRALEPQA